MVNREQYVDSADWHRKLNEQSDMLRRASRPPQSWHTMKAIEAFFEDIRTKAPWWVDETCFPIIDWEVSSGRR